MFFRSVALFQKMILLAIFPPKGCFDFLLDDCPLNTKLICQPPAHQKNHFNFLLDDCPLKAKNLPADCRPKSRFEFLQDDCLLKSKFNNIPAEFSLKALVECFLIFS
jgi:hypothetical protein